MRALGEQAVMVLPAEARNTFLARCKGADVLLVVIGDNSGRVEHAGAVPGKLFDYFGAQRPILVIGPPDSEAARIVHRTGRGLAADSSSPRCIAVALRRLLACTSQTEASLNLEPAAVQNYTRDVSLRRFAEFFNRVVASKTI